MTHPAPKVRRDRWKIDIADFFSHAAILIAARLCGAHIGKGYRRVGMTLTEFVVKACWLLAYLTVNKIAIDEVALADFIRRNTPPEVAK